MTKRLNPGFDSRLISTPLHVRFWGKVKKTRACWLWTASTNHFGYGQIGSEKRADGLRTMLLAHRVSWELANGAIPDGLWVLHKCDNPPCVNPDHLFLGTGLDNINDMNQKGRNWFQSNRNPSKKLTDDEVARIRERRRSGERLWTIALDFGVTQGTVSRIANGVRRRGTYV